MVVGIDQRPHSSCSCVRCRVACWHGYASCGDEGACCTSEQDAPTSSCFYELLQMNGAPETFILFSAKMRAPLRVVECARPAFPSCR